MLTQFLDGSKHLIIRYNKKQCLSIFYIILNIIKLSKNYKLKNIFYPHIFDLLKNYTPVYVRINTTFKQHILSRNLLFSQQLSNSFVVFKNLKKKAHINQSFWKNFKSLYKMNKNKHLVLKQVIKFHKLYDKRKYRIALELHKSNKENSIATLSFNSPISMRKTNTSISNYREISRMFTRILKNGSQKKIANKLKKNISVTSLNLSKQQNSLIIKNPVTIYSGNTFIKSHQTHNFLKAIYYKKTMILQNMLQEMKTLYNTNYWKSNEIESDNIKIQLFKDMFGYNINNTLQNVFPINLTPTAYIHLFSTSYLKTSKNLLINQIFAEISKNPTTQFISHILQPHNITHTNYLPYYNYSQFVKKNITRGVMNGILSKKTNNYFFIQFIINYLEKYTGNKVWVRLETQQLLNRNLLNLIKSFINLHSTQSKRSNKLVSPAEFLEIFALTLKTCDLQILLTFIKKSLENTHFKNHKKILSIIFDLIKKNKELLILLDVKGFSFDIRGKVGVTGNAKKRHIFFSIGQISTTTQYLKSQWQQSNVWTPTGQMGITCLIQY